MELAIFWSKIAEEKLLLIFEYYKKKASSKIAQKVINKILIKTEILLQRPKAGAIEPLLLDRTQEFRYLVCNNYKILYYINSISRRIIIANVFDTRQNPIKIKETKN